MLAKRVSASGAAGILEAPGSDAVRAIRPDNCPEESADFFSEINA